MILEFFDVIDDLSLCDKTIQYFNNNQKYSKNKASFFDGRTLSITEINDVVLRKQLKCVLYKVTQKLYKYYNVFVFPEFADIVHWHSGQNMVVHVDDSEEFLKQRHYTAVCYLNDDYLGGETFLPKNNYKCEPKKGKVLVFPSNYPHGVTTIENGSRYTMAMWFTRNENFSMH